ncbi:MAG: hypothetical protein RL556_67 [Actinomycetota bacterium]
MSLNITHLVEDIFAFCHTNSLKIAVAESLTGGALSSALVSIPGASKVFLGSVVAYQPEVKQNLLGVDAQLIADQGVVNAQVAEQMASGVRSLMASQLNLDDSRVVGIATTGVAGPESQDGADVGIAFVAITSALNGLQIERLQLSGSRNEIREQTVTQALLKLREHFVI